jgi:SET domain-containing protein
MSVNLVVRESRIGLGAFAKIPFGPLELIVDWSTHPLFQKPPRIPPNWRFKTITPGVLSGPIGPEEHPDAYINHSCEPNAEIIFDRPKIHLIARRKISEGEEVTFDYSTLYKSIYLKCNCGTPSCRKIIRGAGQL